MFNVRLKGFRIGFTFFIVVTLLTIIYLSTPAGATPLTVSCVATSVQAYDMGGGTFWDRNFVIDVYGTTRPDGFFLYYDSFAAGWRSITWSSLYLINNNTGVRFGVSTLWAYANPLWTVGPWRYVYPC